MSPCLLLMVHLVSWYCFSRLSASSAELDHEADAEQAEKTGTFMRSLPAVVGVGRTRRTTMNEKVNDV